MSFKIIIVVETITNLNDFYSLTILKFVCIIWTNNGIYLTE